MRHEEREDHPRACGENIEVTLDGWSSTGSPPRMRGKPAHSPQSAERRRITPAHAGKTASPRRSPAAVKDHPRACGENLVSYLPPFMTEGSPPRMRGKPEQNAA